MCCHFVTGIILCLIAWYPAIAFDVYWNVPSQVCKNYGIHLAPLLNEYGVLVNDDDRFHGGNITIFYEAQLGLYPHLSSSGEPVHGGIPQRGSLSDHLEEAYLDMDEFIPAKNFNGLGVIDWEAWRPVWEFNWGSLRIYREISKKYAKELKPSFNKKNIDALAEKQWEESARLYMSETLSLAKKLRPGAVWGYYLFPDCYNYEGKNPKDFQCSNTVRKGNDKLDWLWEMSTALFPSVYLHLSHLDRYSLQERAWKDQGKLKEAIRVASPEAKIYPYVNYYLDNEQVPEEDFQRMAGQTAAVGADGLVIWGSSASVSSKALCEQLKTQIMNTIGPTVAQVGWNSEECSKRICNNHGKCTWPQDDDAVAWKLFLTETGRGMHARDVVCRCEVAFEGRFCENNKTEKLYCTVSCFLLLIFCSCHQT